MRACTQVPYLIPVGLECLLDHCAHRCVLLAEFRGDLDIVRVLHHAQQIMVHQHLHGFYHHYQNTMLSSGAPESTMRPFQLFECTGQLTKRCQHLQSCRNVCSRHAVSIPDIPWNMHMYSTTHGQRVIGCSPETGQGEPGDSTPLASYVSQVLV